MNEDTNNIAPAVHPISKVMLVFTRTPLHMGAGESVGAIDQPIIRERPTGLPIIPGSSLKGTFADAWNPELKAREFKRVRKGANGWDEGTEAAWLFGSDDANHSFAGAIQFSEARLLAFPVRSAKGSFAWITSPLILRRAVRESVFSLSREARKVLDTLHINDGDIHCAEGRISISVQGRSQPQVVLEEYALNRAGGLLDGLGAAFDKLLDDPVWREVADRLAIVSEGMMSFFVRAACEIAQHVKISDETGTASEGLLFNQENVPSETLFYSVVHGYAGRGATFTTKKPDDAFTAFEKKLAVAKNVFQFGADASTGLGYCTVSLK